MSGIKLKPEEVDEQTAKEMILVGIIPSDELDPIGKIILLANQPFKVIGYATREEFLKAVELAGLDIWLFNQCPKNFYFLKISTD